MPIPSSRMHSLFAACACMAAEGSRAASGAALPPGYTSPTHQPEPGRAPTMQARVISGQDGGPRTWAVIFREGDEIMSGLTDWVRQEKVSGAHLTAIGALSSALFGWFDKEQRAYRDIPINEQVECVGLIGDIGLVDGKPQLHIHGSVAGADGNVKGGHFLDAVASPTLEVFVTEIAVPLHKRQDPSTTLELFDLAV